MGSSRLPGKTMRPLMGKPVLWYVIDRARKIRHANDLVVLTTTRKNDNRIEQYCRKLGVGCFRESEHNLIRRYKKASILFKSDIIIRLTADNPFFDPQIIEEGLKLHRIERAALTTTRYIVGEEVINFLPKYLSFDIIESKWLQSLDMNETSSFEREHIIPYFFNRSNHYKIMIYKPFVLHDEGFCIDTSEDFLLAEKIMENLNWAAFTYQEIYDISISYKNI